MKFQVLARKTHYWLSAVIALPFLLVLGTGILLQLKKDLAWIQPPEQKASQGLPLLNMAQLLESCRSVPEAAIATWDDVDRIDIRPRKNLAKVTTKDHMEVQVDMQNGRVLSVKMRRSDWIESLHDGSWFHPLAKTRVFLPMAILLLLLYGTGIYLFALPILRRRR